MRLGGLDSFPTRTATNQQTNFSTKPEEPKNNLKTKYDKIPEKYKVGGAVIAGAMLATIIAGAAIRKKSLKGLRNAEREYRRSVENSEQSLRDEITNLQRELETKNGRINELERANCGYAEANSRLTIDAETSKARLEEVLESDLTSQELRSRSYEEAKSKIEHGDLGYDINSPINCNPTQELKVGEKSPMVPRVKTQNRSWIKELEIPQIAEDGSFEFQLPMTDEVKITRMNSKDFKPIHNYLTSVTENYADSVRWGKLKTARDYIQNYFDGHGQTLDGVKFKFSPAESGKYKVRIEGASTYTPDKAIFIGESTKREDAKAAGNYGEGLKMSVLKLLRDGGAEEIKIGSDNWNLTYKLAQSDISDKRVLAFDLDRAPQKFNGNYLEFETSDRELLDAFRENINMFYHSGNKDFRCPDYENSLIGITLLKPRGSTIGKYGLFEKIEGEKGSIYIAGQRFEFDGDYKGLEGATVFIKEKPPKSVLDPSRDRTSLNNSNMSDIGEWVFDNMSKEERINFICQMEPLWEKKSQREKMPIDELFGGFLEQAKFNFAGDESFALDFPKDRYVAYSYASPEVLMDLESKGYKICDENFRFLGMQTIKDLLGGASRHTPVQPNETELKKVKILKEALKQLSPGLKDKYFSAEELDAKIYLFDNKSVRDVRLHGDTRAEAIVWGGESKGFWIDRNYLNNAEFGEVLETALHELSHKAGGDESMAFSYELTDVNKAVFKQLFENPRTKFELRTLNTLWKEVTNESKAA